MPVKLQKADFTTVMSYEGRAGSFECWASRTSCFHPVGGAVKLVEASLCTRKDLESSFHHCGGHVKHVQASLSARKDREISLTHVEVVCTSCRLG